MNTFLDFLSDNTFFAIFSGVIIVLVLAFIVTLVKGKKEDKKPIEDVQEDSYLNAQQEVSNLDIGTSSIDPNYNYEMPFETQIMETNSETTGYQATFTNYIPDLNDGEVTSEKIEPDIPNINFENAVINEPIIPEAKELELAIKAEEKEEPVIAIASETVLENEDMDLSIIPDFATKEEVDVEPITETSEPEEIEMPIPITETPELAFALQPTNDNAINEDIKIEPSEEYDYEKTEIFDFPDFSKTEIDSEKLLVDVEKIVMEAANKYIDSIMKS